MTIHPSEPNPPAEIRPALLQEGEARGGERVPPYGDGAPMDNSGFGRALAVACIGFLALVGVVSMVVRHEGQQGASNGRSQSAAVQPNSAPTSAPTAPATTQ